MLSIGWPEMMIVAAAALIIVGPRDLPAMLRTIGQMAGRVRRMSNEFRSELNKVASLDDVKDIRKSITAPLRETQSDIQSEFNKIGKSVKDTGDDVHKRIREQTGEFKPLDTKDDPIKAAIESGKQPVPAKEPDTKPKTAAKPKAASKTASKSRAAKKPAAPAKTAAAKKPATRATRSKTASTKPAATKPATSKPTASRSAAKPAAVTKPAAKKPAAKKPATTRSRAKSASKA